MLPRMLLLLAFVLITIKTFILIHNIAYKSELCDDDFYSGGINNVRSKKSVGRYSSNKKSSQLQKRRPIAKSSENIQKSYNSSGRLNSNSYESYRKNNSISK